MTSPTLERSLSLTLLVLTVWRGKAGGGMTVMVLPVLGLAFLIALAGFQLADTLFPPPGP